MKLTEIRLQRLKMKLNNPFRNSISAVNAKELYIITAIDEAGIEGYGETVAFDTPWYTEETVATNRMAIESWLIPLLREKTISHPEEITELFSVVKRNQMAKAAVEEAIWDLYAKQTETPLYQLLGGNRTKIAAGISLGIEPDVKDLLKKIEQKVIAGCPRVKVKIKKGWDMDILREIRRHFPTLPLMADANSAYCIRDLDYLRQLDEFDLMMIEQPFEDGDFADHAQLQRAIKTPVCLDESIHSLQDVRTALELGSCKVINIKIGRVGGLAEAKKIHDYCFARNIPVWCGGMLEAGIGRAHNIALASLPGFTLPGDIGGSAHYWKKDIIHPEVVVTNGEITVPKSPGIGYEIDRDAIRKYLIEEQIFPL
ncbi:o-succinylbenzoate synthase [Aciduricibacillus chroicocephali]|uniref:o-succinylbenzoate synthase n=1 Tax=Aciduricibacillus chroicocephali TaxID=3054939 RepID=A0ABY9L0P7_9BACI|nr:o-succinylbenzoate synthase [Bacillaceae bacterium 44XB]